MGYSCLARWSNSSTTGLDYVKQNIVRNHSGIEISPWHLTLRSYRFTPKYEPGDHRLPVERSMYTVTMGNNVYVSLEDPVAQSRVEYVAHAEAAAAANTPRASSPTAASPGRQTGVPHRQEPSHYRSTVVTVSPPGALEQLLTQLNARWVPTRQSQASTTGASAAQRTVTVEGSVFRVGVDCLVRVGNVRLASGEVKGMFLEAEYLPLPVLPNPELLTNLLTSILPPIDAATKIELVDVDELQWSDVLWSNEEPDENELVHVNKGEEEDDIFAYEDEPDSRDKQKGDWSGPDRDLRSAFLVNGSLKMDGII